MCLFLTVCYSVKTGMEVKTLQISQLNVLVLLAKLLANFLLLEPNLLFVGLFFVELEAE